MKDELESLKIFEPKLISTLQGFYQSYKSQVHSNTIDKMFETLIEQIALQIQHPYPFEIFHQSQHAPFNFFQLGMDFIRPLIDFERSTINGICYLEKIQQHIANGENVILLANHQTEPDPQIISLLIQKIAPKISQNLISVAGHRVTSDPIAVPLSRGCNLLCIYSKKHMSECYEEKAKQTLHNQRTLKKMGELLEEGSQCIYVAPSGGRDRLNPNGELIPANFDSSSVELFRIVAKHAKTKTHFYPLALKTYSIMPPPPQIEKELGEQRIVKFAPAHLAFGSEVDMSESTNKSINKKELQTQRAHQIWSAMVHLYRSFPADS